MTERTLAIRDVCCFLDDGSAVNMAAGRSEMSKDPPPACFPLAQRFELGVITSQGGSGALRSPKTRTLVPTGVQSMSNSHVDDGQWES